MTASGTAAVDLYSFACTMLELVTGRLPQFRYHGDPLSAAELQAAADAGPLEPAEPLPPALVAWLLRGLRFDPAQRWPDARTMRDELAGADLAARQPKGSSSASPGAGDRPSPVPSPETVPAAALLGRRALRQRRRLPRRTRLGVAGLLPVLALLTGWIVLGGAAHPPSGAGAGSGTAGAAVATGPAPQPDGGISPAPSPVGRVDPTAWVLDGARVRSAVRQVERTSGHAVRMTSLVASRTAGYSFLTVTVQDPADPVTLWAYTVDGSSQLGRKVQVSSAGFADGGAPVSAAAVTRKTFRLDALPDDARLAAGFRAAVRASAVRAGRVTSWTINALTGTPRLLAVVQSLYGQKIVALTRAGTVARVVS